MSVMNTATNQTAKPTHRKGKQSLWRIILFVVSTILVIAISSTAIYLIPYSAASDAVAALHSTANVTVTQNDKSISFLPHTPARVGLIFYPGAKVDPAAYAITMRTLADSGYATFIVKMPLNIALLAENRADDVIVAHPEIHIWAVGGHSLGGVAACDYAASHMNITGLLLFAAYPSGDISQRTNLQVVSISGSRDGLATNAKVDAAKHLLPPTTTYIVIQGGIHGYFGDYGQQDGDGQPTISREQAQRQITASSLHFLQSLT
jgi:hypothetical protein